MSARPERTGRSTTFSRRTDAEQIAAEGEALRRLRTFTTVTIATGADAVGTGRDRFRRAVEAGQVPSILVGNERRIPSAVLLRWLGLEAAAVVPLPAEGVEP